MFGHRQRTLIPASKAHYRRLSNKIMASHMKKRLDNSEQVKELRPSKADSSPWLASSGGPLGLWRGIAAQPFLYSFKEIAVDWVQTAHLTLIRRRFYFWAIFACLKVTFHLQKGYRHSDGFAIAVYEDETSSSACPWFFLHFWAGILILKNISGVFSETLSALYISRCSYSS